MCCGTQFVKALKIISFVSKTYLNFNVPGTVSTTSVQERFVSYRRVEKKEPYFSKFFSNIVQRPNNKSQSTNNRARLQFNEQYQRTIQNHEVYRHNHFLKEDQIANEKETVVHHFQRITRDHIHKNEQFNRFEGGARNVITGSQPSRQYYRVNNTGQNERRLYVSRSSRFPTRVYQTDGRSYRPQEAAPRQDIRWKVHATSIPRVTVRNTLPPSPPSSTGGHPTTTEYPSTVLTVAGQPTTTEDPMAVYRKYKAQYEFPDYVGEKRRIQRTKEKEAKRLLYKGKERNHQKYLSLFSQKSIEIL